MADYLRSSNLNVYKEQQLHHAQAAWHSATEAKLEAVGRKLLTALQHSQDHYPNPCSFSPADYAHYPTPEAEYPHPLLAKTPNSSENNMPVPYWHENSDACPDRGESAHPDDVLLLVGKSRQRFYLNAESLISGSAYFKHLLQRLCHSRNGAFASPPIAIDCEEHIFEGLLLLMRYGTFEALPPMSAPEIFRLKKEAEHYGIRYMEPSLTRSLGAVESGDDCSDMSSVRSQSTSPRGSPKSMTSMSSSEADKAAGRRMQSSCRHEDVRLACSTHRNLAELPEFPPELADPARLVLVSCLDRERASIYTCKCSSRQWALNFHHRHAFCASCGQPPNLSPKHFTEMFMAASAHYSSGQTAPVEPNCLWRVWSDSTCMLRFVSSAGNGPDACSCSNGGAGAANQALLPTIWAANYFYSHAFCTCCGESAKGPVLLSLTLALRYGGDKKASKCSARSSFRIPAEKVM